MESISARNELKDIGVGKMVSVLGIMDFPNAHTTRRGEITSVDENSVSIKKPDGSNTSEVINYDKIISISGEPLTSLGWPPPFP